MTGAQRSRWRPVVVLSLLAAACLTPTDDGGRLGELRVQPVFPTGDDPATRDLVIDSIHTRVRRGADPAVVDMVRAYSGPDEQAWIIDLESASDQVDVSLELRAGSTVLYRGESSVDVADGSVGRATAEEVLLAYVGQPFAARIDVTPSHLVFSTLGTGRQLQATAHDEDGTVLPDKALHWTSDDPGVATVDATGLVIAVANGNATITAAADGVTGSAAVTVDTTLAGPVDPGTTTITADSASLVADGISTSLVTVVLLDAKAKPLGKSAGVVLLATTMGTLSAVTDLGDGTYRAVLTAGTVAGEATITGTLNGAAIVDAASVTLRPGAGAPGNTTIAADSTSMVADGTSTSIISVVVLDAHGNSLEESPGTVLLATTLGTLGAVTDLGDGTYRAVLTAGTVAGDAIITGMLNDAAIADAASVALRPGPGTPGNTTITADSASIVADGTSTSTVTVVVLDAHGNPVDDSPGTVQLATTLGTLSAVVDHGGGRYSATLTSATGGVPAATGTALITGTLNDVVIADSADVELRAGAGDPMHTTIDADSTSLIAESGSSTVVTVTVFDAYGHRLEASAGVVTLESTLGMLSGVTDRGDGTYTATLTAVSTGAGAVTPSSVPVTDDAIITGRLNGVEIGDKVAVTFLAAELDEDRD